MRAERERMIKQIFHCRADRLAKSGIVLSQQKFIEASVLSC